ncbi:hypothetical protein [Rubrimonas cliftonensis]|uniref:Uncharacterized protein n=1 Tax=Rubrimonas cliftonensis TaxID=89524 RepID=A0A1H4ER60_9RHOB|nr:hypothetical protein [Rubrimonas cliftonensis]SEA87349.1 hypothetical protein SAMN05444370_11545 [Rubrimonas cliftonensis]
MNVAIYRILNLGAKDWPPHAGDRAAQRASIQSALKTIRMALSCEGGHVHIGNYGVSVHYSSRPRGDDRTSYTCGTLSGYSLRHCHTALAAMVAGAPWVDTRPVTDLGGLMRAPMIACGRAAEPGPWHALSFAPRAYVFETLRRLGAHVGEGRRRP